MGEGGRTNAVQSVKHFAFRKGACENDYRDVPEETPIAISYNGSSHAVMMSTPTDLEDLGVGFSLTEGIISQLSDIHSINIETYDNGIDVQLWISDEHHKHLSDRRRFMAGPVGCGLCGVESLQQVSRVLPKLSVDTGSINADTISSAMRELAEQQQINALTRAVHAAGFYVPGEGLVAAREDVGRHNALDKLIGALARANQAADSGLVAITSRVSVELVQKSAMLGIPILAAISAPTALAIRTAEQANLTLVALVRGDEFDVYTHPHRINFG